MKFTPNLGDGEHRLALDWKTLEYRAPQKPKFPDIEMAKSKDLTAARVQALLGCNHGGPAKADRAGRFVWNVSADLWTYAANRIGEISDSVVEIDRAMRLGFNWDLGPFELWMPRE